MQDWFLDDANTGIGRNDPTVYSKEAVQNYSEFKDKILFYYKNDVSVKAWEDGAPTGHSYFNGSQMVSAVSILTKAFH